MIRCFAELGGCCAFAEGHSGQAGLLAHAAKRWLARSAAGVKLLRSNADAEALAYASLVSCLPALEDVSLSPRASLSVDQGRLLEALALCPRLRALDLFICIVGRHRDGDPLDLFPGASAYANLSSLTKLSLAFGNFNRYPLADVVGALVPLAGLAELSIDSPQPPVVPAALGQLKGLRCLQLWCMSPCVLEAGCLDLPTLESLTFGFCDFEGAEALPGVTALQCLTSVALTGEFGSFSFYPELVQLARLASLVVSQGQPNFNVYYDDPYEAYTRIMLGVTEAPTGPLRLPADMGRLRSSLVDLDISGLGLAQFPLALTQLVALEFLDASRNEFAELPAGIMALSRLTELTLGRLVSYNDLMQLHAKRPLNVVAPGDLSGFPALCTLTFQLCEVVLCMSLLGGTVHHTSLASMCFCSAHPAPDCAPMVLQLSQDLRRLRRGSILNLAIHCHFERSCAECALQNAQALPPFPMFQAALAWCAL